MLLERRSFQKQKRRRKRRSAPPTSCWGCNRAPAERLVCKWCHSMTHRKAANATPVFDECPTFKIKLWRFIRFLDPFQLIQFCLVFIFLLHSFPVVNSKAAFVKTGVGSAKHDCHEHGHRRGRSVYTFSTQSVYPPHHKGSKQMCRNQSHNPCMKSAIHLSQRHLQHR